MAFRKNFTTRIDDLSARLNVVRNKLNISSDGWKYYENEIHRLHAMVASFDHTRYVNLNNSMNDLEKVIKTAEKTAKNKNEFTENEFKTTYLDSPYHPNHALNLPTYTGLSQFSPYADENLDNQRPTIGSS